MSTASVIYAEIDIEMCMIMSIKFVWIFSRRFTCPHLSHTHTREGVCVDYKLFGVHVMRHKCMGYIISPPSAGTLEYYFCGCSVAQPRFMSAI